MNEQVKKWAEMANPNCQGAYDEDNGTVSWTAEDLEKFASTVKDAVIYSIKSCPMTHCRVPYDANFHHQVVQTILENIKQRISV